MSAKKIAIKFCGFLHLIRCRLCNNLPNCHSPVPFIYLSWSLISWQFFLAHSSPSLLCYQDPGFNAVLVLFYAFRSRHGFSCLGLWALPLAKMLWLSHRLEAPLEVKTTGVFTSPATILSLYLDKPSVLKWWGFMHFRSLPRDARTGEFLEDPKPASPPYIVKTARDPVSNI